MQSLSALVLAALAFAHMSGAQNILRWKTVAPCAKDYGSRTIMNDTTNEYSDNTPKSCIERCDAAGSTFAGVEFGKECHCGTGLKDDPPIAEPASECNMPCTGDSNLMCGGPDRIQIYKSPALPAGKYSPQGCYADPDWDPAFENPSIVRKFPPSENITGECTSFCQRAGYELAGLNDESTCKCSERLSEGAVPLSKKCDWSCDEDWCLPDMQGLEVFKYEKA